MVTWGTYEVVNHQTRSAPRGTVNFGYHEGKTVKNMKEEAVDIRKGRGFNKIQRISQKSNTESCAVIGLV